MNKIDISVIIPVYNSEKYIHRCIDSVLSQTFYDYEVILVDDGSTDKSGEICDEYAQTNEKIKVIHQKNSGVAAARQTGIDFSQGLYSIHVDSDDWIENTMLDSLFSVVKTTEAEMIICDYYIDWNSKSSYNSQKPSSMKPNEIIDQLFINLHGSLWNKLIRTSIIKENGLKFYDGVNYCEDLLMNVQILKYAKKIKYLPKAFYHYVQDANPNALTSVKNEKWLEEYKSYQAVVNNLADELGKPWIKQQTSVNLMAKLIKQKGSSNDEYKLSKRDFSGDWNTVHINFVMKVLLAIANLGLFSLSKRMYSFLSSIKNM